MATILDSIVVDDYLIGCTKLLILSILCGQTLEIVWNKVSNGAIGID